MIIASLGAGLLQLQLSIDSKMEFSIDRRRALYIAEAGIAEAALAVSSGRTGIIASEAVPAAFGSGVYWVEADDLPDDRIVLRCTAQVGHAELKLQSMVLPSLNPVTSLGLFGSEGVTIGWGSTIDGYHSGRGRYADQLDVAAPVPSTGSGAIVGSDGDVRLEDPYDMPARSTSTPTHVFGTVRPGLSGSMLSSGAPQLIGSVEPFESPPYLPEIALPTPGESVTGDVTVTSAQLNVGVTASTWVSGNVEVVSGATLTLEGPTTLRCARLTVLSGGRLVLDDSAGPVHIYVEDGLNFVNGSILESIAPETDSRGTFLSVAGATKPATRVSLNATGTFHGALYAPNDVIVIPSTLRWIGSAVARVVFIDPAAHVTIDRRLLLGCDGVVSLPQQLVWQLVPLGTQIARSIPVEPRIALAMRGVTPVPSSVASIETRLELQYIDLSGQPATYRGAFASFNPARARRVVGARWEDPRDGSTRSWVAPVGSESTGAIEALRGDLRKLRATVQLARPNLDVAALTNSESMAEAAAAIDPATLAAQPLSVQRALRRLAAAIANRAASSTAPIARGNRAVNAANGIAFAAELILSQAQSVDPALLTADSLAILEEIENEVKNARAAADRTQEHAAQIHMLPMNEQEREAENAEAACLEALDHQLNALGLKPAFEASY